MAYPNYFFPANYPNYYNPLAPQQQNQQQAPLTIQRSGFVPVQSEQEARSYPVAPGNSITFKDESQPYCYVKTMGFNQLDRPIFEKYRLVKEEEPSQESTHEEKKEILYALKSDLGAIWSEIEILKDQVKMMKEAPNDDE